MNTVKSSPFSVLDFEDEQNDTYIRDPKKKAVKMLRQIYNLQQKLDNGDVLLPEQIEKIKTRYKWEKIVDSNFQEPIFQTKKQREKMEKKKINKMKQDDKQARLRIEKERMKLQKEKENQERNIRWQEEKRYRQQQEEEKRYREQQEEENRYREQQEEGKQYVQQLCNKTQLEIDVENEYKNEITKSNNANPKKDAWRKMQLKYSTDKNVNNPDQKKLTEIIQILNNLYGK